MKSQKNLIALNFRNDKDAMKFDERQTKLAQMFTRKPHSIWRFQPRNEYGVRCGEDVFVTRKVYLGIFAWYTVEEHPVEF